MSDYPVQFMSLPNELLLQILDDADPYDFESLALSCRHLYSLANAVSRISEHNHCKRWPGIRRGKYRYMPIGSPVLLFLDSLIKMPQVRMQRRVMQVWRHVALGRTTKPDNFLQNIPDHLAQQDEIVPRFEAPGNWLHNVFTEIQAQLPELQKFENWINPAPHGRILANEDYYLVLFLFALPHLQHLVLDREVSFTARSPGSNLDQVLIDLGSIIASDMERKHFQYLESVTFTRESRVNLASIARLFHLPLLKTLVVSHVHEYYNHQNIQLRHWQASRFVRDYPAWESYNAVVQSPLETLVLSDATVGADELRLFFRPLTSLRCLIWEDGHHSTPRRVSRQVSRKNSAKSTISASSDDELDVTASGPELYRVSGWEHSLWKPHSIMQQIASTHGCQLHSLGLVCHENIHETGIMRREQIVHFKQFTQLTHLAFDVRILRPRIDLKLPSLTSTLPTSIQVVRIHLYSRGNGLHIRTEILTSLLKRFTEVQKRNKFPHLRKIMIRTIPLPDSPIPGRRRRKGEDVKFANAEAKAAKAVAVKELVLANATAAEQESILFVGLESVGIDVSIRPLQKMGLTAVTLPCWDRSQDAKAWDHDCCKCFHLE